MNDKCSRTFDINAGGLQGEISIIYYLLRLLFTNINRLGKISLYINLESRNMRYPAVTITDIDYEDYLATFDDSYCDAYQIVQLLLNILVARFPLLQKMWESQIGKANGYC